MELKKKHKISVIAHRGYNKNYPENTMLAFKKAMEVGADYIELDVHKSRDGVLVVIHDGSTRRTGNSVYDVEQTDFETLRGVDVGKGEKIPSLEEVLDLCKGKMGVQIEIKQDGIAKDVVELVESKDMVNEVLLSSFKHLEMKDAKRINPKIGVATLEPSGVSAAKAIFMKKTFVQKANQINADAVHPHFKFVNKKFCTIAHKLNLLVNPWTVDSKNIWESLIEKGVDAIITNDPEGLIDFLEEK